MRRRPKCSKPQQPQAGLGLGLDAERIAEEAGNEALKTWLPADCRMTLCWSQQWHAFREPQSEAFRTAASHGLACAPQVAAKAACLAAQALHALLRGSCCECRFGLGSGTQDAMDSEHSPDLAIAAAGAKRREANDSAQFQLPKQRPRGHVCCRSCRTGGEGCC